MELTLRLEEGAAGTRYKGEALYQALRQAIRSGQLPPGMRLPPTRELAARYGVSRGTATAAYDRLAADGYVAGEVGRGTYVCASLPTEDKPKGGRQRVQEAHAQQRAAGVPRLSRWGERLAAAVELAPPPVRGVELEGRLEREAELEGRLLRETELEGRLVREAEQEGRLVREVEQEGRLVREVEQEGRPKRETELEGRLEWEAELEGRLMRETELSFEIAPPADGGFPYTDWFRLLHAEARKLAEGASAASGERGRQAGGSESGSVRAGENERQAGRPRRRTDAAGDMELREAIAAYLRRSRGLEADAEQIAVVNGSMQAIALLAHLLVGPGDRAVCEQPGYGGIRRAIAVAGAETIAAPIDERGLLPGDWEARLLFVTPGRQFPTGALLPMERRLQLLDWAGRRDAYIVEDDYDTEFRYVGRPLEPLKALDREGRVIFVGTFTRTMYPGLRLGYVLLPPALKEPFRQALALFEPEPPALLEQRTLAAFMRTGLYERSLRRMRRTYAERFKQLAELLGAGCLAERFEPVPTEAGLHLFAWWRGSGDSFARFREACARQGLYVPEAGRYFSAPTASGDSGARPGESDAKSGKSDAIPGKSDARPGAAFSFAGMNTEQLEWAGAIMRHAVEQL